MSGEEEYRMVNIDFDDKDMELITPQNIFAEWSDELIEELAELRGVPITYTKSQLKKEGHNNRTMLIENLSKDILSAGEKVLIRSFDKAVLDQLVEPVIGDLDPHPSKNVLQKKLYTMVEEVGGLAHYIKSGGFKAGDQKILYKGLLNYFGADTDATKREALFALCEEEISTFSLTNAFSAVPAVFLRSVCDHIKIYHGNCNSTNILAECIIKGEHYEPREVAPKKVTSLSKKPKSITKKLKKEDLLYWFKATELSDFCAESGLRSNGKKTELAKRIIDFFDPEKENDVPGARGRGKTGKAEKSGSAKSGKSKSKSSKSTKTKTKSKGKSE